MNQLKYKVIKNEKQYNKYCNKLEDLISKNKKSDKDEIELLTLLIENWDDKNNSFKEIDPIELLKELMRENGLKAKDLVNVLELSKGTISKILNYQKGLSKETIRKLSNQFKMSQEAFNRPYKLVNSVNRQFRDASLMNTKKKLEQAN